MSGIDKSCSKLMSVKTAGKSQCKSCVGDILDDFKRNEAGDECHDFKGCFSGTMKMDGHEMKMTRTMTCQPPSKDGKTFLSANPYLLLFYRKLQ